MKVFSDLTAENGFNEGGEFYFRDGELVLQNFIANSYCYEDTSYEFSAEGKLTAKEDALIKAWNYSAGTTEIDLNAFDVIVLFGFRGVGRYTFSRSNLSVHCSRRAFSAEMTRCMIDEHVRNNVAYRMVGELKKLGLSTRTIVVEEPLYGKYHHSLNNLNVEQDLHSLKEAIDEECRSAAEVAGCRYLPQPDIMIEDNGAASKQEYLLSDNFHVSELACSIIRGELLEMINEVAS